MDNQTSSLREKTMPSIKMQNRRWGMDDMTQFACSQIIIADED